MIERYPEELYDRVLTWAESDQTYVRRAAPVSLLESTQSFRVNQPWERVLTVVEKLQNDPEDHVLKGIGWLLKYAHLAYPNQVEEYLRRSVDGLPRVVFRYALEKTPPKLRAELMSL